MNYQLEDFLKKLNAKVARISIFTVLISLAITSIGFIFGLLLFDSWIIVYVFVGLSSVFSVFYAVRQYFKLCAWFGQQELELQGDLNKLIEVNPKLEKYWRYSKNRRIKTMNYYYKKYRKSRRV